jgi:extracellular elastinolytic metalloproteinase
MESPNDGERSIVANPADALASPFGWHDTNGVAGPEFTITRGNNVNAYADTIDDEAADPGSQPDGGPGLDFDHPIPTFDASPLVYRDAAVDNLFFWNNLMHDVTYRYGFTEEAGNFQASNYSGDGRGGDDVQAEAQDGSGALNANFATPEDGTPGRMQMYLWVDAFDTLGLGPEDIVREYNGQVRDGDLDSGVIAHEYGHGISNRLVGGPDNVSCLRTHDEREGEGWSDFWSYALTMRPGDDGATPRGIGTYVVYHEGGRSDTGIRITPYSTDMKVNPSTYDTIKTAAEPHGVGYVWASMLWDLYWNLVEKHGFNPNPYDSWKTGGNNLAIQLVVDGMKFAACEPGFEDARDAIIAADAALTGNVAKGKPGKNECLIWRTFARRGLGVNAKQGDFELKTDGVEGYAVPKRCKG